MCDFLPRQNTEKPTFRSICRSSLAQSMFSQRAGLLACAGLLQNIRRGKFSFVKRWMKIEKSKDVWKSKVVWKLRDDWNFTSIGELYWWIFLNGFTSAQSCLCSVKSDDFPEFMTEIWLSIITQNNVSYRFNLPDKSEPWKLPNPYIFSLGFFWCFQQTVTFRREATNT